ncbi:MAG: hypothetical protein DRI39_10060 [Chloroflexi bacterium]|nr:MAG: hypothetical protein DRI39_10060 [Chloroflexota bacterium]RLC92842.1 MAG: hypothetical protein DRI40_09520 [Chloroflexota bacterium]
MPRIQRHDAEKLLASVPEAYAFRCHDGRLLRTIRDLAEALTTMTDDTFAYHANEQKNDFGNWVSDVIGDQKLARDLARSTTPTQAARKVQDRIAFLSQKLG